MIAIIIKAEVLCYLLKRKVKFIHVKFIHMLKVFANTRACMGNSPPNNTSACRQNEV